jgi:linoleate 9S-lipoxygenase
LGFFHFSISARRSTENFLADPRYETRLLPVVETNYVPRDEVFGHLKMADFYSYTIKALVDGIVPAIRTYVDLSPGEFDSFEDVIKLYEGGIKLPNIPALEDMRKRFPLELIKGLVPIGGDYILKLPKPQIIKGACILVANITALF